MRGRTIVVLLLMLTCWASFGAAQEITGQIRGTVTDSSGAVIPDATITVNNVDRGQVVRTLHTNASGEFVAPLLPIGKYSVVIEAPGFKKYQKTDIVLNVSDRLVVDASLEPGAAGETVSVEAAPQEVNLQSSVVEGLITGTQVRELPLNNRNYEQLITLQPGVTSNAADQIYVGTTNPSGQVNIVSFSINGNRQSQNNWTIDGADNVDHGSNITLLVYPSVDAISEFKVERSNYSPEFGRSSSGQINVVTRAGASAFHGGIYEFFRNDVLNANNALNKQRGISRPVLRYNDFGGTIGGPLYIPGVYNQKKDRTFFFFSEELRRVTTPVTTTSILPPSTWKQGIFNVPVCSATNAAGACTNVLPAGQQMTNIDPVAAAYLQDVWNKLPAPATPADLSVVSVFPGVFNYREELIRVDHIINSKFSVMGRYINDSIPTQEPFGLFGPQSSAPGVANTSTNSPGRQFMARATMQLTDRTYNEIGYAYSYGAITSDPTGSLSRTNSPHVAAAVKLPYTSQLNRIPNLLFDDDLSNLAGFGQYRDYNRNHNIFDNYSWAVGKHNMKFGFSFNHYQKKENAAGDNVGNYEFDSTNMPTGGDVNAQDFANFLQGYVSSDFLQAPADLTADIRQNLWEFYGQDEWRIRPNLTVSYGIRYSYFPTPTAATKNLTTFDPALYSVANAPQVDATGHIVAGTGSGPNGLIIGSVNSPYGAYITRQDKTNFAPRLGFAWDPTKKGRTSVRAGIGIFYDSTAAGLIEDNVFNNVPFIGNADFGGGLFMRNLNTAGASASTLPPSVWTTDPRWVTPYSEQWNLDVQQEVSKGWIVDVGYVGNQGKHLAGVWDINQVAPGVAQNAGLVAPGAIYPGSTAKGEALNSLRPYRGFMQIGQISPRFKSNYNALQTSLNKRFTNSFMSLNYTWSKSLTDNQTDRSTGVQWTYCIPCEYGRSQLDRRHVFTGNFVYDTPWYRNQSGFVGHFLGGYEFSGILTINSGLPFTVLTSRSTLGDPAATGYAAPGAPNNGPVSSGRPNQVGNPNSGAPHTYTQWFNASAFVLPTVGGQMGTEHRGAVNGPGLWRYDMSLMKNTKITEKLNLQFRAEAFNLFNHANPQSIGTTRSTASTYNHVTAFRDPRIMQLALKLQF